MDASAGQPAARVPDESALLASALRAAPDADADAFGPLLVADGPWRWDALGALIGQRSTAGDGTFEWFRELLGRMDWAASNPAPSPGARVPRLPALEAERMRIPFDDLFVSDDPRLVRADREAGAVVLASAEWHAAGRSPDAWLLALGRALPGCGQPTCCRTGLFESALRTYGLNLRAGVTAPPLARRESSAPSPAGPKAPPAPSGEGRRDDLPKRSSLDRLRRVLGLSPRV